MGRLTVAELTEDIEAERLVSGRLRMELVEVQGRMTHARDLANIVIVAHGIDCRCGVCIHAHAIFTGNRPKQMSLGDLKGVRP